MRPGPIHPGSVWFCDFEPVRGRKQGKDRPALVVSSAFHLELPGGALVSVLPLTTVERPGWLHRVAAADARWWVITERVRTVSSQRFRRPAPEIALSESELAEVDACWRRCSSYEAPRLSAPRMRLLV